MAPAISDFPYKSIYYRPRIEKNLLQQWLLKAIQADPGRVITVIGRNGQIALSKQLTSLQAWPLAVDSAALHLTSYDHHQTTVSAV